MNWFMRLLPQWHINERNLTREIEKILDTGTPYTYLELETRVLVMFEKFGLESGSVFIVWGSIPQMRPRFAAREAGLITVTIRVVTLLGRFFKSEVLSLSWERQWYAPVSKCIAIAAKLEHESGCEPFIGAGWKRTPMADTPNSDFQTTLADVLK